MVRSWIRQALRASGVAILVPAAVLAAIVLSVLGGGGNVGSLGEVLRGPAVPPAEAAAPVAAPQRDERPRRVAVARATRGRRCCPPPRRSAPARGVAPPPARRPVTTTPEARRPARPPAQQPAPRPVAPPPAPRPHPIHDTGTQVAQAVRPLPVAGPVAADAVQAVVDLVDPPA